jgi:hypothetical protein
MISKRYVPLMQNLCPAKGGENEDVLPILEAEIHMRKQLTEQAQSQKAFAISRLASISSRYNMSAEPIHVTILLPQATFIRTREFSNDSNLSKQS